MHKITGMNTIGGGIVWQVFDHGVSLDRDEGLQVVFPLHGRHSDRKALEIVQLALDRNDVRWLIPSRRVWQIDTALLRKQPDGFAPAPFWGGLSWLQGAARAIPSIEHGREKVFDTEREITDVRISIYKEDYHLDHSTKIFLSHKGADKPLASRFFATLKQFGLDPWIDDAAMAAGTELHRGIKRGFKESCAAVFFITPNFRDETYLGHEVNYAIEEKTSKGGRFAVITLVFKNEKGERGIVPDLLRSYVWKEPADELAALNEIVKAIPIVVGPPSWRPGL